VAQRMDVKAVREGRRTLEPLARAAAAELRVPLVTWDAEQRDRAAGVVTVLTPEP
jgi:hypothetical protein